MGFLRWLFGSSGTTPMPQPNTNGLKPARSFYSRVAGVTHVNPNGSVRQAILTKCQIGESLALIREPSDEYPEAIEVYRQTGEQLGFIPSETAERLSGDLDDGVVITCEIAELTGGIKGKPTRGCNIEITIWEK